MQILQIQVVFSASDIDIHYVIDNYHNKKENNNEEKVYLLRVTTLVIISFMSVGIS